MRLLKLGKGVAFTEMTILDSNMKIVSSMTHKKMHVASAPDPKAKL